ncbi:MAG: hypothetical protein Q9169_006863 [Polycauliona sp. 2 TL-2023]
MAGSSEYPWLLDLDEEELSVAIENSLYDFWSASEGDESFLDEQPHHASPIPDHPTVMDLDTSNNTWAQERTTLTPTPAQLSARAQSFRPAQALYDISEASGEREMFADEITGQSSVHAPQSLDVDPLTELQVLRARMDMLQAMIPPQNQSNVLGDIRGEDVQFSSPPFGLLDQSPLVPWQNTDRDDWMPGNIPFIPLQTQPHRQSFQQRTATNCWPYSAGDRARRALATHAHQQPDPASTQLHHARTRARLSAETPPGASQLGRQTLLYYYMSSSGTKLVERQLLSPTSVSHASKRIAHKPELSYVGRSDRGQNTRLRATASRLATTQQSALSKRKRFTLQPDHSSEQSLVDGWDGASSANSRDVASQSQELDPTVITREPVQDYSQDTLGISTVQQPAFHLPFGPDGAGWPTCASSNGDHPRPIPVEIFELIGRLLPRDSIQNMRLVNREFERKISCLAFKVVVVPFKPKIYETTSTQMSAKAMGKQKESIKDNYSPGENHVKDGMRVFEQWGPQIKKFALTFEVDEETLTKLKPKRKFEVTEAFWGSYRWPHKHYYRYEQAAKLEQKADETSAMTTAFSKLTDIREFGLSISSGLGWLSGKDASDRAKLLKRKPTVFGSQHTLPDRELRENIQTWDTIERRETSASKRIQNKAARGFFRATKDVAPFAVLPRLNFSNTSSEHPHIFPPLMFDNENLEAKELSRVDRAREGEVATTYVTARLPFLEPSRIHPRLLSSEQEDWLMEMKWAQEAFLSSWCIALLDNPSVFHSLRTFNIANISSQNLASLQRDDIWRALPSLQNLTVLVSPDWRRVSKDSQGNVSTEDIRPSFAQTIFWNFLSALFEGNTSNSIKSLTIGYTDGGEHATGMYARNQNILPAPIDKYPFLPSGNTPTETLHLPSIEELILVNCWLTPTTLRDFFTTNNAPNLKSATFDSVSLTANTNLTSLHDDDDDDYLMRTADSSLRWLTTNPLAGSWPDIIDTITPGATIADARYIHGLLSSPPDSSSPTTHKNLESLHFKSCGYVRLPNMKGFDQSSLPDLPAGPPQCLKRRWAELHRGMLSGKDDELLGTVVPCMRDDEEGTLEGVWGLEFGWQGKWEGTEWECREDAQAEGGSGRFNGSVKRD